MATLWITVLQSKYSDALLASITWAVTDNTAANASERTPGDTKVSIFFLSFLSHTHTYTHTHIYTHTSNRMLKTHPSDSVTYQRLKIECDIG